MGRAEAIEEMTYAEYVVRERSSPEKHEYLHGHAYAMAGGTPAHGALSASFGRLLGNALVGRPCRVYSSDVRVRVRATGLSTYPDLSVVCGTLETDPDDPDAIANPILLGEVLSPSTASYDRGAKAAHYRRIPSLREYVLVAQEEPRIELHRFRDGRWQVLEAVAGEQLVLASIGAEIEVSAVYADPRSPASAP
jgi:Uma2 family endonuclease